jgi:hypothetical protein
MKRGRLSTKQERGMPNRGEARGDGGRMLQARRKRKKRRK